MSKKYLVKFDIGLRDAFGEAIEVLTEKDMKVLKDFCDSNKEIYYGEISGKHSEIYGSLEISEYKIISSDPDEVAVFEKLFPQGFGAFSMMYEIYEVLSQE